MKTNLTKAALGAVVSLVVAGCTVEPATPTHETVVNNPPDNRTTIVNPTKTVVVPAPAPAASPAPAAGGGN